MFPLAGVALPAAKLLGDEVAAHLADRGAALLANHGLVTCASTPEKALHHAGLVERTAKI
jgi:L-fuculose-phosphate aldolase